MKAKVKLEGGRQVQRALRQLPDATAKRIVRKILKARAQPIADAARARVPKDDGQLRQSIVVSTKLSRANRRDRKRFGEDDIEMFVGPGPLPHAHMIEFGWEDGEAQPYMRPAWDQAKPTLLDGIGDDLWKEIRKAAERAARKAAKAKGK